MRKVPICCKLKSISELYIERILGDLGTAGRLRSITLLLKRSPLPTESPQEVTHLNATSFTGDTSAPEHPDADQNIRVNVLHMLEPAHRGPCGTATYGSVRLLPGVLGRLDERIATNQSQVSSGVRRDPLDGPGDRFWVC